MSSRVSEIVDAVQPEDALLSPGNVIFTLSRILTQARSPDQVMCLVTAAIPSIVPGHTARAWHPSKSGDYYQRAPQQAGRALATLTKPGRLETGDHCSCWAFPLNAPLAGEPIFLMTMGSEPLSSQDAFLLSLVAQLCGAVIGKLELVSAEQANFRRVATRNAELESSVSSLTRIMEIHRRLTEICANAGEIGIADTLHELTTLPVLILDGRGNPRAIAGDVPAEQLAMDTGAGREELIGRLRRARRALYDRSAWVVLASPSTEVHGVIALIDPTRSAGDTDIAALEYAATVLSVELARVQSVGETELRSRTARERAQEELTASRARLVAACDIARERVARDLHDGAQQRFVTSLIHLQLAEQLWEDAPEHAKELLGLALRDAKRGINDLRELAAGMHPGILTQRGLAAAIDALAAQLPIPVELEVPDQRLPAVIETSVYFFCSEALTNVIKHARAQSASVRVDLDDRRCIVEVRDDGMGGATLRTHNSGLIGLRDRIGALSGTMDIIGPAAGGTVVRASVPLPREPTSPESATPA
jgi:signal transduction histidine kinase